MPNDRSSALLQQENLFDFFQERLIEVRQRTHLALSDDTCLYLVQLMADRARADRPAPPEGTLAELHARGHNRPPSQQLAAYRELGDRALHLLGCFEQSLQRKIVSPGYYADMGAAAYHRVDLVIKGWFSDAFGPVFTELAERFAMAVQVLRALHDARQGAVADLTAKYPGLLLNSPVHAAPQLSGGLIWPGHIEPES